MDSGGRGRTRESRGRQVDMKGEGWEIRETGRGESQRVGAGPGWRAGNAHLFFSSVSLLS